MHKCYSAQNHAYMDINININTYIYVCLYVFVYVCMSSEKLTFVEVHF